MQYRYVLSFTYVSILQEENVNINITSLRNKLLLSNVNATCEIYTAAILLKNKLMHTMFYQETNVSVNAIRLFESALVYLDSIAAILWQIYVRKHKTVFYCLL